MARRPGQGVETRGGWKTTLQHIVHPWGPSGTGNGGDADEGGGEGVPHVPLKVRGQGQGCCCIIFASFLFAADAHGVGKEKRAPRRSDGVDTDKDHDPCHT